MAPEQLLRGETSVKSDIYSLGVVLYEIFVGKPMHENASIGELQRFHEDPTSGTQTLKSVDRRRARG